MQDKSNQKITLLQALLIFAVMRHTASMRYIPSTTTDTAHQAAWLTIIVSMVIYIPFFLMLFGVVKKFEGNSLHDIFCKVFGNFIGKSLCVLYMLWLFILLGLYLRYSGGNLVTTVFVGTDEKLIMFLAVLIIGIMLRWGIQVISRMNKIIFVLMVAQFVIILFFLFLHFRPDFVTPVSTLDIVPVIKSSVYPLTLLAYLTPLFVFNDQIVYDKKNRNKLLFIAGYITIKDILMMLALIGMLGWQLISKLRLPFFSAVENISLFNSSAGIESLFMSIWILAEFISISFFTYCISRLLKSMFGLKSDAPLLTPLLGFALFFAAYFSSDIFQLTKFSKYVAPYLNLFFGLAIPVILFITGKIRKMI
jgi:spore germination protein KB